MWGRGAVDLQIHVSHFLCKWYLSWYMMPQLTPQLLLSWILSSSNWIVSSFTEPGLSNQQGKHWVHTKREGGRERESSWPRELAGGRKTQPVRKEFLGAQLPTASALVQARTNSGVFLKVTTKRQKWHATPPRSEFHFLPVKFWVSTTKSNMLTVFSTNSCRILFLFFWDRQSVSFTWMSFWEMDEVFWMMVSSEIPPKADTKPGKF